MSQIRGKNKPNHLVRLVVSNWAFGWAVGQVCAAGVLLSNIGDIRVLMFHSAVMWQALALLSVGFGATFGGVVAATAIMLLPTSEEETNRGGGARAPVFLPAYALAKRRAARA